MPVGRGWRTVRGWHDRPGERRARRRPRTARHGTRAQKRRQRNERLRALRFRDASRGSPMRGCADGGTLTGWRLSSPGVGRDQGVLSHDCPRTSMYSLGAIQLGSACDDGLRYCLDRSRKAARDCRTVAAALQCQRRCAPRTLLHPAGHIAARSDLHAVCCIAPGTALASLQRSVYIYSNAEDFVAIREQVN